MWYNPNPLNRWITNLSTEIMLEYQYAITPFYKVFYSLTKYDSIRCNSNCVFTELSPLTYQSQSNDDVV